MKHITNIFLSTALATGATTAIAQQKPHAFVDDNMKTKTFILNKTKQAEEITFERGFSDDLLGIVCEWKTTGRTDPQTGRNIARVHEQKCSSTTVPETWMIGKQQPESDFIQNDYRTTNMFSTPIIREEKFSRPNAQGVSSNYARIWDFSKNEVCLQYRQGQFRDNRFEAYEDIDAGCHPMPDNDYARAIRGKLNP